ncbi:DUF5362 family protein [Pontibacter populi]|uniref:DUF5362 family protein n=1 Tax=Pontibacter populi TaxID=890055 RepID=A0ABV1RXA4_9BACT
MDAELYADAPAPQNLSLNLASEDFLRNTAKWGKFLAIVGFVMIGFIVLMGIFAGSVLGSVMSKASGNGIGGGVGGTFFVVFYLIFALLYFFPVLYLYRFSDKMQHALRHKNEDLVTESFKNLKSLFKFMGVLTIIMLAFYALGLLFMAIGAGIGSMM